MKKKEEEEKLKLKIKKYLELENVSVLAGAGASWHLGTPTIGTIPDDLKEQCKTEIKTYFGENANPPYESLVNCLQADRFIKSQKREETTKIDASIEKIQKWLFENCNTETTKFPKKLDNEKINNNRYHYHEILIKKLLQRPNNLKRVNLFTTNYDMAFDYALDNLGVHYLNGFMGVHNRCFRPEVYNYDLYYPGQSATGKVHRAEKVLRYYKLHGSLSWVATKPTSGNIYGIKEIPLSEEFKSGNELMIYPCVSKKSFTLDLPYSELFRQFSQAINQPQSVLFCIGYSFNDEHINDIIKQSLSNPSFTLFIVNYTPTNTDENKEKKIKTEIEKLNELDDKRIIILNETFIDLVDNILPDLYEEEDNIKIAETMNKVFNQPESNNDEPK